MRTAPAIATREIRRLVTREEIRTSSWTKARYQRRLNPPKTVRDLSELKENRATTPMGR